MIVIALISSPIIRPDEQSLKNPTGTCSLDLPEISSFFGLLLESFACSSSPFASTQTDQHPTRKTNPTLCEYSLEAFAKRQEEKRSGQAGRSTRKRRKRQDRENEESRGRKL